MPLAGFPEIDTTGQHRAAGMPISSRVLGLPLLLLACVLAAGGGGAQGLVDGVRAQPPRPELLPAETPVADLGGDERQGVRDRAEGAAGGLLQLVYPLAERASEVDPYGWRYSEARQAWRMHVGQDLIAPEGTPVLAMLADPRDGYGLTVVIDHGRGWQTLYAHLLEASVQPGDLLQAGDGLGRVGQTGRATTAHLHVELRRRHEAGLMALDPTPLLQDALHRLADGPLAEGRQP
jgi:murein DD-endopeptidase MepM/ murein hydrolase activator NlpD